MHDRVLSKCRRARRNSWLLLSLALVALTILMTSRFAVSESSETPDVFLWDGQPLDKYYGLNAADIIARYKPVTLAFPNLKSCKTHSVKSKEIEDITHQITTADIQKLPSIESKAVCLFYDLSRFETIVEISTRLHDLGFYRIEIREIGKSHYLTAIWKDENGSLLDGSLVNLLKNLLTRSWRIKVTLNSDGALRTVFIEGLSHLRL